MPKNIINDDKLTGQNLRQLRIIHEATIEEIAEKSGFSKGFISFVEQGKRKMKFQDLRMLLGIYGFSLGRFLSEIWDGIADDPGKAADYVIEPDDHIHIDGDGGDEHNITLLRPVFNNSEPEILRIYLPGNYEIPYQFEIPAEIRGAVRYGTLLVEFEDDEFSAESGNEFKFDGRKPHRYRNFYDDPCSVFLFITPPLF